MITLTTIAKLIASHLVDGPERRRPRRLTSLGAVTLAACIATLTGLIALETRATRISIEAWVSRVNTHIEKAETPGGGYARLEVVERGLGELKATQLETKREIMRELDRHDDFLRALLIRQGIDPARVTENEKRDDAKRLARVEPGWADLLRMP